MEATHWKTYQTGLNSGTVRKKRQGRGKRKN
ncbi:hypothetical protein SBA6_50019 [Candidatus Sulfopaludibacter sp. SbA6]|nr:hypothetical protein SBA6_50019 [Candidatus Sulfopaludibacter sp. SbA6]